MARSNPRIPTVNIITQDPNTGYVIEGQVEGTPPSGATYAGIFALECQLIDTNGSGIYEMTGTVAVPAWTAMAVGGSGITQLTGAVTAGPGSGSQAASIANGAVTATKLGATFPFVGTPDTISPTAALDAAPTFTGAALAGHSHDLQQVSAEVLSVTAGTGVSSAASMLPIAVVESVYITAGGVTGAVTVIPAGQTPATAECTYNPATGVFQFLIADAVTAAVITYVTRAVTSVSAGTPAGTNDAPAITVTGASYTPAGTITPA